MNPTFVETVIQTETGSYDIEAGIRRIGDDLLVAIRGGEKPHIGAIAVAPAKTEPQNPGNNQRDSFCFLLSGP